MYDVLVHCCIFTALHITCYQKLSFTPFFTQLHYKRRKMNVRWTLDDRKMIEGYTAHIWLRYGSGMEKARNNMGFNMAFHELSMALGGLYHGFTREEVAL